jgi:hypothetical protein
VGESSEHFKLVRAIRAYIAQAFTSHRGLAYFVDSVESTRESKPPRILGHVPDVYVVDVPTTFTIIGEAKTIRDIQTERSREQIAAFLEFLALRPNSTFILAVPLPATIIARTIINSSLVRACPSPIRVIVLDDSRVY